MSSQTQNTSLIPDIQARGDQQRVADRITLYYRAGSSDKVYQAAIEPKGTGFMVSFSFGRRGTTLQTGNKTPLPVSYEQARKIYDNLVAEKTAKGYTPGQDGTPYQQTDKANRATGILPQLLNPIDESYLPKLLSDESWWAQEKFDGKRVLIRKEEDQITGINRSGLVIDLPEPIVAAVLALDTRRCLLDGEAVGDWFITFDLLQESTLDLASYPYHQRYGRLVELIKTTRSDSIRFAGTAIGQWHKEQLLASLREQHKEGIVFKNKDAPYTTGRPSTGGTQLKFKFCTSASCIVARTNGSKQSVKLELIDGGRRVGIGNVTIPANHPMPRAGTVVEVRYLYAHPGGCLFQPVYLSTRDDIHADSCTVGQLKFKTDDSEVPFDKQQSVVQS